MTPRPRWSAKSTFIYSLALTGLVACLVLAIGKRSVWFELELTVTILALCFFAFLCYVLYHGVEVDENERFDFTWMEPPDSLADLVDGQGLDLADLPFDEGPLGCILGLLATLVFIGLLPLLLWIGVNLAIATTAVLVLPMFYLYRRSLRHVVKRGEACRGDLGKSAASAALYTVLGSGWLYLVLFLAWKIATRQAAPA